MFHSKQDVDRHVNEVFRNIKSEYQRNSKCYQIAKLYYKFKDYKSAIKYINRYILTTTNSAAAHRLLGECYLGVNLKVKAIDSFKTSLELNGSQNDLVLKICTLLMDPDVSSVTPRTTYWLERAESLFPTNPVVFQLREHLLKSNMDGKQDNGQLEKLIMSEISARPADVTVRIRLLNFFVDTKRYKVAYQHALEIEERNTFSNDLRWYDCLCNVVQAYEKANNCLGFSFYIKKIMFFEKRADLFMQEFQEEVKTLPECSAALFAFDQSLHSTSKIDVPQEDTYFFVEFMKHMRAQLSFHLATLALKRAKREYGIWPKAFRTASPLLLQATQNTMDLEEAWYNMWVGRNKMENEVKQMNRTATFRISQAGHILLAWSQNKGSKFLEKVSQSCGGKWQNHVYQDVFYNREHQQAIATSHFINDPFFANVPMRLLTEAELNHFDEVSQSAYPDSLHHLVWLGLAYCNSSGYLSHDFRCTAVPDLQFTVSNLSQTGPETLNQLDVDAFLYASVICAKSSIPSNVSTDRPSRLPVSISEELCSPAQADWWAAVYKTYINQSTGNLADMRLKLRKGIEVIRVYGAHGLHVKVIVMLAKLFQERATKKKNSTESNGLEDRAYLYWTAAIPLLEKIEKNQQLREVPNRLFDYRGKDLTLNEVKGHLEDGRLFLACRLMKQGRNEQAIEAFQSLKSPYATFYQALIYEKLASEEVNHRPESITSENRSQHIILLTRARDALYLTLDRLRSPSADPNHPLNTQLQDHLDQIEKHLAMIDPDSNINRNGDSQSDETDTAPGPLSPDVDENLESSFNAFSTTNYLGVKNHSTSRVLRQNLAEKHRNTRFEARPSPERLDAQLRHLVQANSNGLQHIVEQLKEMKSIMQIELKDLGCVTRDLLAEMKRWNDRLELMSKRPTDVLKPEDLFELKDEDYEDICQLPQTYPQNYQLNRQMTGTQGTSTVTYGTPVPSPVPPVPSVLPTSENPLIPPAFYPGPHQVPPIDPSLLLYQSVGYYQPEIPYGENQNLLDYRGAGIQKGVPFAKPSFKVPEAVPPISLGNNKTRPPNVVITSSDTLPAFTSAGTPAMSVTVPPQHIRGLAPSTIPQKPSLSQVHPFQIQMPPQAQLVKESPTEKLNSLVPATSLTTSPAQTGLVFGVKSTPAEQTTPIKETGLPKSDQQSDKNLLGKFGLEQKLEGNKLFESRGSLCIFDKKWEEKGMVLIRIIHDEKLGKVRVYIVEEPNFKVHVDHYIAPDMTIEPLANGAYGWTWTASNIHSVGTKPNETSNLKKFSLKFNTLDESKDFEFAFNEGRRITREKSESGIIQKSTPSIEIKAKVCEKCKGPLQGISDKCSACESKEKSSDKTNLGGFTFISSPIVKPPTLKLKESTEKPKEQPKPSPFSDFSFSSATATPPKTDTTTKTTAPFANYANSNNSSSNFFTGIKYDPNAFKKDANFKDFEGKGSQVFGYLNKPKASATTPKSTNEKDDGEEEFVPTAEFKPVVDLPDLVDVKTGEENDKVLFDKRAKLLRFDKDLKEWKERGIGNMRVLLNEETGKVRLIMRRELVLKVCCNHYLEDNMEFQRMKKSDKALSWCANDYSEGEFKTEFFALKFHDPGSMIMFEKAIQTAKEKMKSYENDGSKTKETSNQKPGDSKPLSELFKPKAGSWECGSCLVRNNEDVTTCVSCGTAKPGTEAPANVCTTQNKGLGQGITFPPTAGKFTFGIPPSTGATPVSTSTSGFIFGNPPTTQNQKAEDSKPLSELFKPKAGSWECSSCLVRNNEDVTTCVSCGIAKPGTEAPTNVCTIQNKGLGKGITFPPTTGKFTFGIPPSTGASPVSTSNSGFIFGNPPTTQNQKPEDSRPVSELFKPKAGSWECGNCLTRNNEEVKTCVSCKTPKPGTESGANVGTTQIKGLGKGITFPPNAGKFTFGIPPTTGATPVSTSVTPVSTSATSISTSATPVSTSASGVVFGNPTTTTSSTVFGSKFPLLTTGLKPEGKEKFEFSISNIKPITAATASSKAKTLSPKKKAGGDGVGSDYSEEEGDEDKDGDDNGDHISVKPVVSLPDKVPLQTGEEDEDVLFENRAKLFRYTDKQWKERGVGNIRILKHKTNNKIRLLMRRETILKVCLNHYLTPDIEFTPKEEKAWTWSAADFSEGELQYNMFAIRFKTSEVAEEFKKALDDAKMNALLSSPIKQESPEKPKEPTAAMKNFTFAIPNPAKSEPPKSSHSGASDDDVLVVYENNVTPEQREKAMSLHLPPKFYAYLQAPDCKGCPGCDKDDEPVETQQKPIFGSMNKSIFENKSWGSLNFGKGDSLENKVLFTFAGNQGMNKRNPITTVPKITQEAEHEDEDEDEDEDDDDENEDDENDEEDEEDDDEVESEDEEVLEEQEDMLEEEYEDNEGDEDEDENEEDETEDKGDD